MIIYKPIVTIYDKQSKHTAVEGETCTFEGIEIRGNNALAIIINTQNNKLRVPLHVFEKYFEAFKPIKLTSNPPYLNQD